MERILIVTALLLSFPVLVYAQDGSAPRATEAVIVTSTPTASTSTPPDMTPPPSITPGQANVISKTQQPKPPTTPSTSPTPPLSVSPEPSKEDRGGSVLIWLISALAALAVTFGILKAKSKKPEQKDKNKCFNIKKLLDDKINELTDLRGQLESKLKEKGEEKLKETIKGTAVASALELVQKAEKEVAKLEKLYRECIIETNSMKRQVVIIHGGDAFDTYEAYLKFLKEWKIDFEDYKTSKADWKKGLSEKLGPSFEIIAPSMPNKINAKYLEWKIWFDKFIPYLEDGCVFVGHSMGGIFLAKYFSENIFPKRIGGIFLVAAPHDDQDSKEPLVDFALSDNLSKLEKQCKNIFIYHSKDDYVVPFTNFEKYKKELKSAKFIELDGRGHFNQEEFPEIVKDIKSL